MTIWYQFSVMMLNPSHASTQSCKGTRATASTYSLHQVFLNILKYFVTTLLGHTDLYFSAHLSAHGLKTVYNLAQASVLEQAGKEMKGQLEVHLI